jgi:S-methylmethionine-dependent homocysteine/selenocysteine methylase
MTDKYPHALHFPDAGRKTFERIAALLDLDDWKSAIARSGDLALQCAEEYVKGKTEVICVIPRIAELLQSNPEFLNALCEEGVIEWLTPLVLAKSATVSND